MDLSGSTIGVIGLGYVGLPLAVAFGKDHTVVGYDQDTKRIAALSAGDDRTGEVTADDLSRASGLRLTTDPADLAACQVFIVTVPTPIHADKTPDLSLIIAASRTVGKALSSGAIVIYESTVFPGCTREVCAPVLEEFSGLTLNKDFFVGYSPERVNPGDPVHRLADIVKVTSGSTPEAAAAVDALYRSIVTAGTHPAASIEVAEAAKVIENTQRDLNIALMNELSIIFDRLGLDTHEVLEAAGTKWNFLRFTPGLVGGHCIGVDPYYLTHRAQAIGYHPEVILAGRRINDGMGRHVADRVARTMMQKKIPVVGSRILVLGLTFKENCPDVRNSRVGDVIAALSELNAEIDAYDPWAEVEAMDEPVAARLLVDLPDTAAYDAVILAVGHRQFSEMGPERVRGFGKRDAVFFDVKGVFEKASSDGRL